MRWNVVWSVTVPLLRGLGITLELAAIVLAVGTAAGILGGVLFVWGGRPTRALMSGVIFLVRGIPLLAQIFGVFFVLPLIGLTFSPFVSAALALSIFASATITEIVRGGIQSIPHGQLEGAISLGFRYGQAMRTIILPQAFRLVLPPLVTQFVFLIKATSLISLLGVAELMYAGREVIERTLLGFEVMTMIWVMYTAVCYPLTVLGRRLEAVAQKGFRATPMRVPLEETVWSASRG